MRPRIMAVFYLLSKVVDVFQMHSQKEPVMIGQLSVESFLQLIYLLLEYFPTYASPRSPFLQVLKPL
jgi:hypothetical protein